MKSFIFIHTVKFALIAAVIWIAISKYDSTHSPINQSLWVYMFIYLPAIVGYVEMTHKSISKAINTLKNCVRKP